MKNLRLLLASLLVCAGSASAQTQLSDLMVITLPGAAPLSFTIIEGVAPAGPETAIFNLPWGPDGLFAGLLPTTGLAIRGVVALFEPIGEIPSPGEQVILWPSTAGPRILSDLVISFSTPSSLVSPAGVALISDGDANLPAWSQFLLSGGAANAPLLRLDETGTLQDLTGPLGTPFKVEVQSDVSAIPEPGSAALLLSGIGVLGWVIRRRALGQT